MNVPANINRIRTCYCAQVEPNLFLNVKLALYRKQIKLGSHKEINFSDIINKKKHIKNQTITILVKNITLLIKR